jgi:non-homologous end joining protein Ku
MVSLPVSVAPAVSGGAGEPKMEVVGPNGEKLRQVYLTEDGGAQVDRDKTKREYNGRIVDQDDLTAIKEQTTIKNLDILEVCPKDKIDTRRIKGAYYVYSHKKNGNAKAFNVFVRGLAETGKVAVVKWTPAGRQQLLALYPDGEALTAVALAFAEDFREADDDVTAHAGEEVSEAEVEMAAKLLNSVAGDGESLAEEYDEAIILKKELLDGAEVKTTTDGVEAKTAGADLLGDLEAALKAVESEQEATASN